MYQEYSQTRQQLSCQVYVYLTGVKIIMIIFPHFVMWLNIVIFPYDLIVEKINVGEREAPDCKEGRVKQTSKQIKKFLYININSSVV